ncbi:MAG: transcriptional regulator [Ilumatobacteraceae bacterium]|jgi:transcriptional regulator with XRE-family HTH domain
MTDAPAPSSAPGADAPGDAAFHLRVGERLRAIRKQKRLSLHDVEEQSRQEFKASVLGAYERGERAISVLRLQRLAQIYGVTVDQLLPADPRRVEERQPGASAPTKLRIDVAKLSTRAGDQYQMLERFLRMIQVQRQDFNGKVITVRAHDTRAIAVMLDVPVEQVGERLAALDLLFVPPTT